jgi:HEAT repeat protein
MSGFRRLFVSLSTICALTAFGPWASTASAQCAHGGGMGPRMSPGLIGQQMVAQQQMLQQQLLLQQIQQQQQLQTIKLDRQIRELVKEGPGAIDAALKDPNPEMRLIAVLTIGKTNDVSRLNDLLARLTDDADPVRQAARSALISLSTTRDGKPDKRRAVDFGPAVNASRTARQTAARKWLAWFERQKKNDENLKTIVAKPVAPAARPAAPPKDLLVVATVAADDSEKLTKELVQAAPARRDEVLKKFREGKGAIYTEALSEAISQLTGSDRTKAREALAARLSRMTAATLHDKMGDENPEVRRAAALAVAMKENQTLIADLIALLEDPEPSVPPAARAALKSLSNQDFGSVSQGDPAERQRALAAWKAWGQKQNGL